MTDRDPRTHHTDASAHCAAASVDAMRGPLRVTGKVSETTCDICRKIVRAKRKMRSV